MARARTNAATRPDDARAHRSIEALKAAFLGLLEHRPFDQIAIRDITDAAGLSYPTFFRRFAGKDELLESIATEEVRRLLSLGQQALSEGAEITSADQLCRYVQEHRRLWRVLLNGGAIAAMRTEFSKISREISSARPRVNPWIPEDLAVPFVTGGIFEIFSWWMRQPEDYPIDNVVKLFNALIVDVTARRRDVIDDFAFPNRVDQADHLSTK